MSLEKFNINTFSGLPGQETGIQSMVTDIQKVNTVSRVKGSAPYWKQELMIKIMRKVSVLLKNNKMIINKNSYSNNT